MVVVALYWWQFVLATTPDPLPFSTDQLLKVCFTKKHSCAPAIAQEKNAECVKCKRNSSGRTSTN